MSWPGRENVAAALFAYVDKTVRTIAQLTTSQRGFMTPAQVEPPMCPALVFRQAKESYARQAGIVGIPGTRTMHFEAWVYTTDGQLPTVVPATQLNAVMDALDDAFLPSPTSGILSLKDGTGRQLALSARIRGEDVDYLENYMGSGMSLLIVPIEVLIP